MLKMQPNQVNYANQVNAMMRAGFGVTIQDIKLPVSRVIDSHAQGWTPEQFVAWVQATQDVTPLGAC